MILDTNRNVRIFIYFDMKIIVILASNVATNFVHERLFSHNTKGKHPFVEQGWIFKKKVIEYNGKNCEENYIRNSFWSF